MIRMAPSNLWPGASRCLLGQPHQLPIREMGPDTEQSFLSGDEKTGFGLAVTDLCSLLQRRHCFLVNYLISS